MTLEAGSGFAGYTILGEVGRGGMGTVYAAQHPRLPRQDALKVLNPDLSGNDDFRQRFIREADIAARLDHPNIVHVYDRGEIDGQLWIATQFIDGVDVSRLLHGRYPAGMPVGEALPIIRATAAALDDAHSHGMLHRDVKPANILLSQPRQDGQRQVYLADFGIARPLTEPNGLTATNLTLGTVAYAAPEQLMGAALDPSADEYALACTAFHLLTGAPPYTDPNSVAVISQHLNAPVPMLSNRRPDLSEMNAVFGKALAKNPQERFNSCTEFAAALEQASGTGVLGYGATQAGMTMAAPPPISHPQRSMKRRHDRRKVMIPAVALTGIGAVVAAGVYFVNNKESVDQHRLDGTYKFEYDVSRRTVNGKVMPSPKNQITAYGAFRSTCSASGCVAQETWLDPDNPAVADTPPGSSWWRFQDGQWSTDRKEINTCARLADSGWVGMTQPFYAGKSDTQNLSWDLQEMPNGTLQGTSTRTILTGDCGRSGMVVATRFQATRIGDISPEVAQDKFDPTEVPPLSAPLAAASPNSPNIGGLYRFEENYSAAKFFRNGRPEPGRTLTPLAGDANANGDTASFWAIQSMCVVDRCVATSVQTGERNVPTRVYELVAGTWQALEDPGSTSCGPDKVETLAVNVSFAAASDGTLTGKEETETISSDCASEQVGVTSLVPFTATRVGDIPPGTVLADPALFLS